MRKTVLFLLALWLGLSALLPTGRVHADGVGPKGEIVVANRGSGSLSIIDARTDQLLDTVPLPAGDNTPEPMYVVHSKKGNFVFVGDRANDRVVVFDADDYSVVTTVEAGKGVFHMWADDRDRFLWVNNDADRTSTVIDPATLDVVATVPMPADLTAAGYIPHDVILDPMGRFAYVTLLGGSDPENDYLVQFSTDTFEEVNRAQVGKDPHVSLTQNNDLIYVPAQNSNIVSVLNRNTLELVEEIAIPGAHGAGMSPNGQVFYTTNLTGGGTDGLVAIDTRTNAIINSADTPFPVPHNIVVTGNNKLFLTHSGGASDKVTIYAVSVSNPIPVLIGEVTVGLNPFGLAYVPK
jgi:DNA-binding beta-propeller fold protein YncE